MSTIYEYVSLIALAAVGAFTIVPIVIRNMSAEITRLDEGSVAASRLNFNYGTTLLLIQFAAILMFNAILILAAYNIMPDRAAVELASCLLMAVICPIMVEQFAASHWPASAYPTRAGGLSASGEDATAGDASTGVFGAQRAARAGLRHIAAFLAPRSADPAVNMVVNLQRIALETAAMVAARGMLAVLTAPGAGVRFTVPFAVVTLVFMLAQISRTIYLMRNLPRSLPVQISPGIRYIPKQQAKLYWRHLEAEAAQTMAEDPSFAPPGDTSRVNARRLVGLLIAAQCVTAVVLVLPDLVEATAYIGVLHSSIALIVAALSLNVVLEHLRRDLKTLVTHFHTVGSTLPMNFLRQASHRLNNSLLPAQSTLDRLTKYLGGLSEKGLPLSQDELAYLRRRSANAKAGVDQTLDWLTELGNDARSGAATVEAAFEYGDDVRLPLGQIANEIGLLLANQQESRRLGKNGGARVQVELVSVVRGERTNLRGKSAKGETIVAMQALDAIFLGVKVRLPPALLRDAMANLIRNGFDAILNDKRIAQFQRGDRPAPAVAPSSYAAEPRWIPKVRCTIEVSPEEPYPVSIAIRDNGPGIPAENRARIGQLYFSTKGATGNGVGLYTTGLALAAVGGLLTFSTSHGSTRIPSFTEIVLFLPRQRCRTVASGLPEPSRNI